jgi:uncharacterized protein
MSMRLKIIAFLAVFSTLTACRHQAPITGYWKGSMGMNGRSVDLAADFGPSSAALSSDDLMLFEVPIDRVKAGKEGISFTSNFDAEALFEGTMEAGHMAGLVHLQGVPSSMKVTFALARKSEAAPEKTYRIEPHTLQSRGATLAAEIYRPKSGKPHPALALLHGSTTSLMRQYTYYADFFAGLGFEVLIFDKRGNGQSTGDYATASFDDLVTDAITCLAALRARESVDKSRIGLWGFSQGAMLLPMVAARTEIPAFLIAVSPETRSTTEAAAFSDAKRLASSGLPAADGQIAAESHRAVERMIRAGSRPAEVESYIRQNAKKHAFMDQTGLSGNIAIGEGEFHGYYWKGRTQLFFPYWMKLNLPVLAVFGEDDDFVDAASNEKRIQELHNDKITTKVFIRANHSLRKAINPAKYPDFDWPRVADGYLEFVKSWLEREVLD